MARLLHILDPGLVGFAGHRFEYDRQVTAAAAGRFDGVRCLCAVDFPDAAAHGLEPYFTDPGRARPVAWARRLRGGVDRLPPADGDAAWRAPRWWNTLLCRRRAAAFAGQCRRLFAGAGKADDVLHIFIPTLEPHHLDAAPTFGDLQLPTGGGRMLCHLVLRTAPEHFASGYATPQELARRLRRLSASRRPEFRFYTDTEPLSRAYADLLGKESSVRTLPIPSRLSDAPSAGRDRGDGEIRLGVMGPPRAEKGMHRLPDLAALLPARAAEARMVLVVQREAGAPPPPLAEAERICADPERPDLVFFDGASAADAYARRFAGIDVALLPYSSSRYRASSSGVLAEALSLGIPAVVSAGTWMAAVLAEAEGLGRRVGEAAADTASFAEAVRRVVEGLEQYRAAAGAYGRVWRERHTAERLAAMLADAETEGADG